MQMLRQAGYGGRVVPVDPKGGTIFGYAAVTSIGAIDPPVDLAVDRDSARRHPRGRRRGAESRHPESPDPARRLRRGGPDRGARATRSSLSSPAARKLAVAGPNCAGIIHLDPAWRFAATFLRDLPPGVRRERPGLHFAIGSARRRGDRQGQCARPAARLGGLGRQRGASRRRGLSRLAGRATGIGCGAALRQSIEDHERFRRVAREVGGSKPVIALFGGRTEIGGGRVRRIPAPSPTTMPRSTSSASLAASCGSKACGGC